MVAGDILFSGVHFGVPTGDSRALWLKTLDQIAALKPAVLIPGHQVAGAKNGATAGERSGGGVQDSREVAGVALNLNSQRPTQLPVGLRPKGGGGEFAQKAAANRQSVKVGLVQEARHEGLTAAAMLERMPAPEMTNHRSRALDRALTRAHEAPATMRRR